MVKKDTLGLFFKRKTTAHKLDDSAHLHVINEPLCAKWEGRLQHIPSELVRDSPSVRLVGTNEKCPLRLETTRLEILSEKIPILYVLAYRNVSNSRGFDIVVREGTYHLEVIEGEESSVDLWVSGQRPTDESLLVSP